MKKLLKLKNLVVALVLVAGLTGIASFVSASQPIATLSYGNESIKISGGERPKVYLHEFGNVTEKLTVKFKISTTVDNYELKLTNSDLSLDDIVTHTVDSEGNIEVDLSDTMNKIPNGTQAVYTLNFIDQTDSDENKNFSVDILVDKKAPEISASIGMDKLSTNGRYKINELNITVRDENFNPDTDYYNITFGKEKLDGYWEKVENNVVEGSFQLPQGESELSIELKDAAGNYTQINESIVVDSLGPEIKVIIDNKELDFTQSSHYTNKTSLSILITDPHLDLLNTTVTVGDLIFKQNEDGTFGDERCSIDESKGILNLTLDELHDKKHPILIFTTDTFENNSNFTLNDFVVDTVNPWIESILFNGQEYDAINSYEGKQTVKLVINEKNLNKNGLDIKLIKEQIKEQIKSDDLLFYEENEKYIAMFDITNDGEYVLDLNVTDLAGNKGNSQSLSFMIDSEAPIINIDASVDNTSLPVEQEKEAINLGVHQNLNLKSTITDANLDSGLSKYSLMRIESETGQKTHIFEDALIDNNQLSLNFSETDSTNELTAQEGTYKLTITATDKAGRTTNKEINFSIDRTRPIVKDYTYIHNDEILKPIEKEDGTLVFSQYPTIIVQVDETFFDSNGVVLKKDGQVLDSSELNWKTVNQITHQAELSFSEDGVYTIEIDVKDKAGNIAQKKPNIITFVVDTTAPEITIDGYKELSNDKEQELTISVNDIAHKESIYTVTKTDYVTKENEILIDNVTIYEPTFTLSEFKENGTYNIKWSSFDWAGHKTEKEVTFTVDTIQPIVSEYKLNDEISQNQGIKYYSKGQEIKIYIDEYHFDSSKVSIDLTEKWELVKDWEQVEGRNDQYVATIKVEEDGYYELKDVKVTDKAGNEATSKPKAEKLVIDTIKPIIHVSDIKNEFYYKKGDKVTINVSIDETNFNPNLSTYTIYRKELLNSEEKVYLSGNITSQTDFKLPTLTENGEYRIVLTAKDMSDNQVEKETELHFYIDHNDPKVSIKPVTANTANGSQQNVSEVVIGLSATDDWKLANTKYTVKRNNEVINVPKQGDWDDFKLSFKDEGYYQVEIETDDQAGTQTVKETLEFTIDRTSPSQLSIIGNANHHNSTTSVKDGESYSTPRINLQFNAQDMYSFDKISVDVTKNGKVYASQMFDVKDSRDDFTNTFNKNANYSLSEEGEYEVTFTVYDQAGNQSNEKLSFEIDRTNPIITSNIEDGKYYNEDFLPEFTLDQPERDEFTFINIDEKNYKNNIPFLINDKVYTISALATDKAQNTTDYNATITVDKTTPTIGINNLITGFFKDTLSPSIFYNDTNLDTSKVSIKLNNVELGAGVGDENGYTKEIDINKDGTYTLEVSIEDLATNVSKQTIDFVLDNEKPVIKIKNVISLHNQPWIPELEVLEEYGYDIIMATLNGEEYDITQPITTEGKNVLFIQVADKAGNTESITIEFILDLTPPKVIIENAETNQLVEDGDHYLTSLDLKIYLDYLEGESQDYEEIINSILLNDEPQNLNVTMENGRKVYHLSLNEFKDYTLKVKATDSAGNEITEIITFTLGDKDIFTKIYENKTVFYSIITIAGLSIVGAGIYSAFVLRNKSIKKQESSEE